MDAARNELVKIQEAAGSDVEMILAGGNIATLVRNVALRKEPIWWWWTRVPA